MDRREFLRTLVGGTCAMALGAWRAPSALTAEAVSTVLGEAAVSGPTVGIQRFSEERGAAAAVEAALEMIGGIDRVIKPGEIVVVKPNLVNSNHGRWVGRVTNSRVIDGVLKAVRDCGAVPIVAEGSSERTYGTTTGFAEKLGLLKVCRRYDAKFVDLNNDEVVRAKVPRPLLWSEFHLARQVLECDKLISVPVMKTHRGAGVTLGMKNLIGTTSPKYYGVWHGYTRGKLHSWERELWRQRYGGDMSGEREVLRWIPLGATIADLASVRPIDLVVVDGTFGEERNSPEGLFVDIKERSGSYLILAGADTVAVDAIGAHVMRQAAERLPQLRFAAAKGLGCREIDRIHVVGERLDEVAVPMRAYILQ